MRTIDADALWKDITRNIEYCDDILDIIEKQPTIRLEQKKGHWIRDTSHGFGVFNWKCSKCGHVIVATTPDRYCGACGCDNNINKEMTKA